MLEAKVLKLLTGEALDENEELCDFTLADQNEACGNVYIILWTSKDNFQKDKIVLSEIPINKINMQFILAIMISRVCNQMMIANFKEN